MFRPGHPPPRAMQKSLIPVGGPRRPHYLAAPATTLIASLTARPAGLRERRFAEERRPGGALASPQVRTKWSTNGSPQVRPDLGAGGYRDRRSRTVQRCP